ncbi:MAG TPA: pyrroline-5-carboxylate reductase [Leucothrix sp.]|nr:pyrroline-5-carboxylate reductase [Leucothrix sp.]
MKKVITFIGAGNMSRSLIAGLIQDKTDLEIRIADPDDAQLQSIQTNWTGITAFTDNLQAIDNADIIVLAVKPQIMQKVCEPLQAVLASQDTLIISIAAGVGISNLNDWLGGSALDGSDNQNDKPLPIVRCMPNTPALVQSGMTGLYANQQVSDEQHDLAESILRAVGSTLWLSGEDKLDAVTAVSGSGPAYYFLVMEAMQNAAQKLGLSAEESRLLVLQTAFGAAKLALESRDDASVLRQRVTSKGGTTEAALKELMEGGLPELFEKALTAAENRSRELKKL